MPTSSKLELLQAALAVEDYEYALKLLKTYSKNLFKDLEFSDLAKLIMSSSIKDSDSLKEAAAKLRIQQTLASKGGVEHANFLCDLGIIQSAIKLLELLHVSQLDRSGKNEPIVLAIWTLFRDIMKNSSKGRKTFIKFKGLYWLFWYADKYPIQQSKALQILIEELIEILREDVSKENAKKWINCFESICANIKLIKE